MISSQNAKCAAGHKICGAYFMSRRRVDAEVGSHIISAENYV